MIEEDGHPIREVTSVMMTTSGFLSSSREGRLPDTRPPPNREFFDPSPPPPVVEKKKKPLTMKRIVEGIKKIEKVTHILKFLDKSMHQSWKNNVNNGLVLICRRATRRIHLTPRTTSTTRKKFPCSATPTKSLQPSQLQNHPLSSPPPPLKSPTRNRNPPERWKRSWKLTKRRSKRSQPDWSSAIATRRRAWKCTRSHKPKSSSIRARSSKIRNSSNNNSNFKRCSNNNSSFNSSNNLRPTPHCMVTIWKRSTVTRRWCRLQSCHPHHPWRPHTLSFLPPWWESPKRGVEFPNPLPASWIPSSWKSSRTSRVSWRPRRRHRYSRLQNLACLLREEGTWGWSGESDPKSEVVQGKGRKWSPPWRRRKCRPRWRWASHLVEFPSVLPRWRIWVAGSWKTVPSRSKNPTWSQTWGVWFPKCNWTWDRIIMFLTIRWDILPRRREDYLRGSNRGEVKSRGRNSNSHPPGWPPQREAVLVTISSSAFHPRQDSSPQILCYRLPHLSKRCPHLVQTRNR